MTTPTRPTYLDRILAQGIDIETAIETAINGAITFLPYRIERALYSGKWVDFGASGFAVINTHSFFVSPDGTKMFFLGGDGGYPSDGKVHQFTLSTAYDVESMTLDGTFTVDGQDSDPQCITFNAAGTRMYMSGQTGDAVYQYNLGTAWEIVASPPTYAGSNVVSAQATAPDGILISPDGTTFLVASGTVVYQYTLSTPGEIIGGSMAYASIVSTGTQMVGEGMCWGPGLDGTPGGRVFFATGTLVNIRTCPIPYSLSGSSGDPTPGFNPNEQGSIYDVKFSPDGYRMWVVGPNALYEYYTSAAVPAL